MELTLLPEHKKINRSYKHFTISQAPVVSAPVTQNKNLDFFYIGRKISNIDCLINAFESGYAAENIQNAKSMLKRLANFSNTIPDIIIAEASINYSGLYEFSQYLASEKKFQHIPFVIDASELTPGELSKFKSYAFIDEVIFLQDFNKNLLLSKVNFLKKVKEKNLVQKKSETQKRIETLGPSIVGISPPGEIFKRVFDIVISMTLLILLSPIFLLIILAIKIESRGPVFYISQRAGRGYKIFDFYKFRTMFVGADEKIHEFSHLNQYVGNNADGPVFFKINNDPRITKVGLFLRNTSLDELPQFFNVLKGDMSLVGNRPLPLYEAASLTTDEWAKRFMAPAGITGLWQIKKRGNEEMSVEERINLDINYADKYNFLYDLWIMANTPSALIQKTNV